MDDEVDARPWLDVVLPWICAALGGLGVLLVAFWAYVGITIAVMPKPPLLVTQCPTFDDLTGDPVVPAQAAVADAGSSLVPNKKPKEALLCQYPLTSGGGTLPGSLKGKGTKLRGDLSRIPASLNKLPVTELPKPCPASSSLSASYLLLLTYEDGTGIWVATRVGPSQCFPVTNGEFKTGAYIADEFSLAQQLGEWPT